MIFHSHANKNSFLQESSLRSWRYCIVVEWDVTAEPSLAAKLREIPSTALPLLPFFGTRLRHQNFNLAPTQYRQLRRLTGKVVKLASFWKWGFLELGSGLLAWAGSQGRVVWIAGVFASPSLSFLPLSYRLAFSVRFFFFALYPTRERVHFLHHLTTLVPIKRKMCLARGKLSYTLL